MAKGGKFLTYNKVLPGAYINFVSKARALGTIADRGVMAMALKNNWGVENKIVSITNEDFQKNSLDILGYDYTSEKLKPFREVFKNAKEIKFYRLGTGEKAKATIGRLNVIAKYSGSRGNDIKIKIASNVDKENFTVYTYIENIMVDEVIASSIDELKENKFVSFSGTGALEENAGTSLTGGTEGNVTNLEYSKFLSLVEKESFNVLIYDGEDEQTKGLFESFTKRLRDDEGVKICTVLYNYKKADFEGIISVKNDKNLVYWVGGVLAGAEINQSVTNKVYDGEYAFEAKYSNSELKEAIENGEFVFYYDNLDIRVLKDINTFVSFSTDKNSDFSNNQIIRVLDSTANDIARIFNNYYLGKMQNDALGRDIFKSELISYFNQLQAIRAIDNFSANDIKIKKGTEKGDVIVDLMIEPVASMDKIYMKCIIE
ncbi:phage tail sheath family protein [[Clostridium] colinum]|uniref:phage tail sheath family protein n=1 Tax=[Clostridium] colinum TaxID=36835 RepID=UPI0020242C2A|nr:phage tail sheath family protein [[Clostridium] colinum]